VITVATVITVPRQNLGVCVDGVNLPHVAKHAFGDQMGPNVQNSMPFGSLPYQGLKNCGLSPQKKIFDIFLGPPGRLLRFSRCWPYFVAGVLFDSLGRTRKAKSSVGSGENPYF
jgi:hypothetical protein